MGLIREFSAILKAGKRQYASAKSKPLYLTEEIGGDAAEKNCICHGDNRVFMKTLLEEYGMEGKINMIYIDPPFFSKSDHDALVKAGNVSIHHVVYGDRWKKGLAGYLRALAARLMMMKDLLAEDGLIWIHLDWHAVHYVKVFLDEIFGEKNFVNEIIWTYKSGGTSKRYFSRKHDTILVYSKSKKYKFFPLKEKSYNRGFKPYRFKGVREYKDDTGWYTMVNMKDVWTIPMVGRTSAERTGYSTQKPERIAARILEACTEEGDICADFFCGSGTLPAAADKMNRRFIACDESKFAVETAISRLAGQGAEFAVCGFEKENNSALQAEFRFSCEEIPASDKKLLTIELKSVKNRGIIRSVGEKSVETVKKLLKEDPLQIVGRWSIDFHYNGETHRPQVYIARSGGTLKSSYQKIIPEPRAVSIKIVDIFGNVAFERKNFP